MDTIYSLVAITLLGLVLRRMRRHGSASRELRRSDQERLVRELLFGRGRRLTTIFIIVAGLEAFSLPLPEREQTSGQTRYRQAASRLVLGSATK